MAVAAAVVVDRGSFPPPIPASRRWLDALGSPHSSGSMNVNVGEGDDGGWEGWVGVGCMVQGATSPGLQCTATRSFLHVIVHISRAVFLIYYSSIIEKSTVECMSSSIRANSNLAVVCSATT